MEKVVIAVLKKPNGLKLVVVDGFDLTGFVVYETDAPRGIAIIRSHIYNKFNIGIGDFEVQAKYLL